MAIGWQIYDMTGSAFDLGMVGLVQFLPTALLVFVAGHAADRFERKRVVQLCQIAEALTALFLAWGAYAGWLTDAADLHRHLRARHRRRVREPGDGGAAAADHSAGLAAARDRDLERRGPGRDHHRPGARRFGLCLAPSLPYGIMVLFWLLGAILTGAIRTDRSRRAKGCAASDDLFAGVRFVRNNPAILGTISLDLFAVLLGGATALLPIYARDILQTGPLGLGILRAAPAVGALLMTAVLARHTINRRVGIRMFQAVIVFGVATVVFALSQWMWLSVLALAVLGAADIVSVVIRFSLVQLATPDEMRGRVGAVNFLFINASNQLGQFESGVTAALFGVDAGRRARRRRHHRDRAVVDEAVSDAAQGGAAGVGAARLRCPDVVVPHAQDAGTHTPRPLDVNTASDTSSSMSAAAYGSLRSRGRRESF